MTSRYSRLTAIFTSFVFSFLLTSFVAPTAQAQVEQITEKITVIHATKHDVSEPLRDVDVSDLPPMRREGETYEVPNEPPRSGENGPLENFTDPALQSSEGNLSAPTVLQNFDGLGNSDNADVIGFRIDPPDPNIEVGDQYIVQMNNIVTAVFDKSGNLVMDPMPNNGFWSDFGGACENNNNGDPIVVHDQAEDRWIVSQFANPGASNAVECVAVSETSDPTGAYYRYEFSTSGNDYPKLGVGTDAYYLSWRDFAGGGGAMAAGAVEKEAVINGEDASIIAFTPSESGDFGTRPPADIDGTLPSSDTPHPFPALDGDDALSIWGFNPDFADPANSTFEEIANVAVDQFDAPVCADFRDACVPQPSGPNLETLSQTVMHRANVRDLGDEMSMALNHTVDVGNERAGVRWYELRNDGSGWSLRQQGTYAPDDGLHRWMGSVAVNPDGGIALGYSVSGPDEVNPSVRFTGRPVDAPLGEMTFQETEIFAGGASKTASGLQNENRWGDYTAMVTDPANPNTFWYVGEYGKAPQSDVANWDTRIASFQFEVDDDTPPEAITDLSATPASATEIDLTFTAPSDPPDGEPAASYDIRYSTDPIETESDFENAQQVEDAPTPSDPGVTEEATVDELSPDTEYFFAIKSLDLVGNTSDLNTNLPVSATTEGAPIVGTDPDEVTQTVQTGGSGSDVLSILNEGDGTLDFSLTTSIGGTEIADPLGDNTPTTGAEDFPKGRYETSAEAPPENPKPTVENPQQRVYQPDLEGTTYYGVRTFDGTTGPELVSFQGNQPEVLTNIVDYPNSEITNAGDFLRTDKSSVYDLSPQGVLRKFNVETGEIEELGDVGVAGWCGFTTDPNSGTIYATTCGSNAPDEALWKVNPDAATVEQIGTLGVDFMIDIAVDGQGTLYGFSLASDALYEIDKETAEITEIGSLGFDANFQQGMTWDTKNQVMVMTAYNGATSQGEWRSVDRSTGSTELIGVIGADDPGGTNLMGWVGTPIEAFGDWLAATPTEGEVESDGSQDIDLSFETTFEEGDDLIGGFNYLADVEIESNDPLNPTTSVPVTLTVEGTPAIGFSDDPLDFGEVFSGTSVTKMLSITNESDDAILQVADLQVEGEAFALEDAGSFVLNPGESMDLPVTFAPDASDTFEGTLSLASSAGDQEIGLTGQGAPFITFAQDSLEQTLDLTSGDTMATQEFEITNEFDDAIPFSVVTEALETSNTVKLSPKLTDESLRRLRAIDRAGPRSTTDAPPTKIDENTSGNSVSSPLTRLFNNVDETGVIGYGNEVFPSQEIYSFDLGVPSELNSLDDGVDSFAGTFIQGNKEKIYWVDNADNTLKTYALEDGSVESIGALNFEQGDLTAVEMDRDPTTGTTYVSAVGGPGNFLFEIDPETAELTTVGELDEGCILAIDDTGQGYCHDLANDQILTVDLETGAQEVVGPTGIDAGFAQSMTYDQETGELLMAAYKGSTASTPAELRRVDRETGETELIGPIGSAGESNELGWFTTPGTGIPWLSTNLTEGMIPAGASLTLEAEFDASEVVEGTEEGQITVVAKELQGQPSEALPVTLTVEAAPVLFLSEDGLGFDETFVNDKTADQLVTLRNDGQADMNINSVSIDSENFEFSGPDSFTLPPGESQIFEVFFTPQETGDLSATLSLEGDEVSGEVSLSGTGIPAPALSFSPQSFDKQAYVGQQQEETVTVTNEGGNPLEFEAADILTDGGTPLVEEGFEGDQFPPQDWFRAGVNDGENWQSTRDSFCRFFLVESIQPGACIYFSPSFTGTQRFVTPQLNTTGRQEVALEFSHELVDFLGGGGFEIRVETTGDGGETWTTVETFDNSTFPKQDEMILISNEDVGSDEFQVAWTFEGDTGFFFTWGIDDARVAAGTEWLAVEPKTGTVSEGGEATLDLSIDASGLEEGTYESGLNLSTNDPLASTASVPFTLNVIEELSAEPSPTMEEAFPNQEFGVDIDVESLNDLGVFSYEMTMEYDPDKMHMTEVITEGTLSEGISVSANIDNEEGTLTIASAESGLTSNSGNGQELFDLEGEGTLISIDAQAQTPDFPDGGPVETTMNITDMVFNEGEPPASPKEASMTMAPLYGDTDLNLNLTAGDAAKVLDYTVGSDELNATQKTHAEVSGNGEIGAFDASLILRRTVGEISCFPVDPSCDASDPALADKSSESSSEDGRFQEIFAWGEATPVEEAGAQSSGEGSTIALPLKTDKKVWSASYGSIRALEVETEIDPDKVSVKGLETQLPDDWRATHHVSDGTLEIVMAGTTPLSRVGEIATVTLQRKDSDATLEVGGHVAINEGTGHELASKEVVTIPDEFALDGTYPNPFRQSATLEMDLPSKASVTVEVYDLLGRKVNTAFSGEKSAGTGRTVQIDGTKLSSGTYFYRARVELENGTRTESGKMTVVQ